MAKPSFLTRFRNFFGFYSAGPKPSNKRQQILLETRLNPLDSQRTWTLERAQNASHNAELASAIGKGVTRSIRLGVIGSGIELRSEIKRKNANRETKEKPLNDRLNTAIETAWKEWGKTCSIDGLHSWHVMTEKMLTSMVMSGDCFVRFYEVPAENRTTGFKSNLPFSIDIVEGDMIDTSYSAQIERGSDQYWLEGILYDRFNRPLTYAIKVIVRGKYETALVPAEQMLPVRMDGELRPHSKRGWPWLLPVCLYPDRLDTVLQANADHTEQAAAYNTYLIQPDYMGPVEPIGDDRDEEEIREDNEKITNEYQKMVNLGNKSGGFKILPSGTTVQERPVVALTQLDEFTTIMLRQVSLAIGITYERLVLDFSKSNFSSSRLSSIMDNERFSEIRKVLTEEVFDVIYRKWLTTLLISDEKFRRESQDLDDYEHSWAIKKQSSVDPQKALAAAKQAYDLGIVSLETLAIENGYDFESEMKTKVKNQELLEGLGLELTPQEPTTKETIEVEDNTNSDNQQNTEDDGGPQQ